MYRILLPVDTDVERSLAQARFVEELPGSDEACGVIILHSWTGRTEVEHDETRVTQTASDVESVREVMEFFDANGVAYELIDGAGDPAELILDVVDNEEPDQIVMGGRKRTPLGKVIFGSVTQAVILDVDVPVTVATG